eukprot:PITA_04425
MIFSFASEDTIAGVLLQKNKDGHEQCTAFMSRVLQNSELKYNTMEKQAYALVKSLKHFKTYVGYSKIIAFVPHSAIKDILTQTNFLGTCARWVTKIQEYDLEIRPTKLVKGQGLAQMLTEGSVVDRKSTSEFCFSLGSTSISWMRRKQESVVLSTAKAEYIATSMASYEVVWVRNPFSELFGHVLDTTVKSNYQRIQYFMITPNT